MKTVYHTPSWPLYPIVFTIFGALWTCPPKPLCTLMFLSIMPFTVYLPPALDLLKYIHSHLSVLNSTCRFSAQVSSLSPAYLYPVVSFGNPPLSLSAARSIFVPSANLLKRLPTFSQKLLIYSTHNKGPCTDPYGKPPATNLQSENHSSIATGWLPWPIQSSIHLPSSLWIPCDFTFCIKLPWGNL